MTSPILYADWVIAALVIILVPIVVALDRWWVFPVVGAGVGSMIALSLGTLSHSAAASVLLLAFLVPIEAAIVGYCRTSAALNLTVAGLWLSFVVWVLRALPMSADTLTLSAFVLPVMFLFLLLTIVAYRNASADAGSRGRATIELQGVLMFAAAAFAYPSRDDSLYLLVAGAVLGCLGVWGVFLSIQKPRSVVEKAHEPGPVAIPPTAQGTPSPPAPGRSYCTSCGSDNEADSAFCRKCGHPLAPAPAKPGG